MPSAIAVMDATTPPLPHFRFHPDPIATGAIKESDRECQVCKKQTGYICKTPLYLESGYYCPWCIASGKAADIHTSNKPEEPDYPTVEYEVWVYDDDDDELRLYRDAEKSVVSEEDLIELGCRTPGYHSWQNPRWLVHCGSPCAFIDYVRWKKIEERLDRFIDLEGDATRTIGATIDRLTWLLCDDKGDIGVTGYLFQCIHCGGYRLHLDRD